MESKYIEFDKNKMISDAYFANYLRSKGAEGSKLENLSILMKGKNLPTHTSWQGAPAQKALWI